MDLSDAVRQVEELRYLQKQWYSDSVSITTPALYKRLQKAISSNIQKLEVKKCLVFQIMCKVLYPDELSDLVLEIQFPLDYPSTSVCRVKALRRSSNTGIDNNNNNGSHQEYELCSSAIQKYLDPFCGCECVEILLEWLSENKDSCCLTLNDEKTTCTYSGHIPSWSSSSAAAAVDEDKVTCFILRYNHLLSGPEHKKEKAMLDVAKKSKLQGGLLWGTPGIIIVVPPSSEDDAKDYASECRAIGKRAGAVESLKLPIEAVEKAGLGGLAQQKRGGKLQEMDTAALRVACADNETLLRSILGVQ